MLRNKFKHHLNKVGKTILKGSKKVVKIIDKNIKDTDRKYRIMRRMNYKQIKIIGRENGIYQIGNGYRLTPSAYKSKVISRINLNDAISYAYRFRINISDIISEIDNEENENNNLEIKNEKLKDIIKLIREFEPFNKYDNELTYQVELGQFLKSKYNSTKIEKQLGSSRPDIIIGNIAIEVKGPTFTRDLETIASKCMRYPQFFKGGLIVVLFDVQVNHRYYSEWLKGIQKTFPKVIVIKK